MKTINQQRTEFKDALKTKLKKWYSSLVRFSEISLQQFQMLLSMLYGFMYGLFACMPNKDEETYGALEDLLPDLDEGITELLDRTGQLGWT